MSLHRCRTRAAIPEKPLPDKGFSSNALATSRLEVHFARYAESAFTTRYAAGSARGAGICNGSGLRGGSQNWRRGPLVLADAAMSVVVRPGHLRQEMIRRGWAATDLARESRLSQATISAALAGRPIAERSLALIAKALSRASVLDVVDSLVLQDGPDMSFG